MKLLIMQSSPTSHHFLPLTSKYSPQHPVLKHSHLYSSLSVRDQLSHAYKTSDKIISLYSSVPFFRDTDDPLSKVMFSSINLIVSIPERGIVVSLYITTSRMAEGPT